MRVLIADPDTEHASTVMTRSRLEMRHTTGGDLLAEHAAFQPQLALVDQSLLAGAPGEPLPAERLRAAVPACVVVAMIPSSEDSHAMAALRAGAVNYLCKPVNLDFLDLLVQKYKGRAHEMERNALLRELIVARQARIVMPTDGKLVTPVVEHILARVTEIIPDLETAEIRLGLEEILRNAVEHGNLEIGFETKAEVLESHGLEALVEARRADPRYSSRTISVDFDIDRQRFRCVVEDEGPGFDHGEPWNPVSDAGLQRLNGRGIFLTRAFFDQVTYHGRGNKVELVKRIATRKPATSPDKT